VCPVEFAYMNEPYFLHPLCFPLLHCPYHVVYATNEINRLKIFELNWLLQLLHPLVFWNSKNVSLLRSLLHLNNLCLKQIILLVQEDYKQMLIWWFCRFLIQINKKNSNQVCNTTLQFPLFFFLILM
jgi:hypothetical protein